jgi:dTDP-4-dehydrorhamnose 3,5-epimerase
VAIPVEPFSVLRDVLVVRPRRHTDDRGAFMEAFKASEYRSLGLPTGFVQDNVSWSREPGTLRGLHFQLARAGQGKLVRCVDGEIFDVAVDIRRGSPTYGRWEGIRLRAADGWLLWIPVGFAHGLWTLLPSTQVEYKVTAEYDPSAERSIRWDDPDIGIEWPGRNPILAPKDRAAPLLKDVDNDFSFAERVRQPVR